MISSCSVCNDAALEERDRAVAKDYRKGNASSHISKRGLTRATFGRSVTRSSYPLESSTGLSSEPGKTGRQRSSHYSTRSGVINHFSHEFRPAVIRPDVTATRHRRLSFYSQICEDGRLTLARMRILIARIAPFDRESGHLALARSLRMKMADMIKTTQRRQVL